MEVRVTLTKVKEGSMKRILILMVLLVLGFVVLAYAVPPMTITNPDGSTVYSEGTSLKISNRAKVVKSQVGSGQLYTGACRILGISIRGATAGDNIGVYDYSVTNNSGIDIEKPYDTRDLEFEVGISVNNSSAFVDGKGAPFQYGIRILNSIGTTFTSVIFDY